MRLLYLNGVLFIPITLQWRHNGQDDVSSHQPHDCLLNRLFGRRSKTTRKLRVTGLCSGNSLGTGEFPAQLGSNAENVSIWWRHHYWTLLFQGALQLNIMRPDKMIDDIVKYRPFLHFIWHFDWMFTRDSLGNTDNNAALPLLEMSDE